MSGLGRELGQGGTDRLPDNRHPTQLLCLSNVSERTKLKGMSTEQRTD